MGESKSRILDYLSRVDGAVPAYRLVRDAREARQFMRERGLEFPVVLKPDVGERGAGVAIIRTDRELEERLRNTAEPVILQQYAAGLEFGVFYFRYPNEPKGRILSITEKRFPELTGDGRHSLDELILRDSRAVCLAGAYARAARRPLHDRPAAGERIQLVEIGSHCRGAIFLDGSHLKTNALEAAVDRISQAHPGFYFGRYDVRTPSLADFQAGRFQVIELNGVSAEATHIYDPAVSLLEAYRVLFRHWRLAFAIGDINRAHGAEPMTVTALLRLVTRRKAEEGGSYVGTIQVVD